MKFKKGMVFRAIDDTLGNSIDRIISVDQNDPNKFLLLCCSVGNPNSSCYLLEVMNSQLEFMLENERLIFIDEWPFDMGVTNNVIRLLSTLSTMN